jgi:non-canonical (house-cleaning) NTP pyrophosphatase
VLIDNTYSLLCVAVITDNSGVDVVGMSDTLPLPQYVSDQIANGKEFGVLIREFQESLVDNTDDNIKNWTDELISRRSSFLMAIGSAYIQYLKLVANRTKKNRHHQVIGNVYAIWNAIRHKMVGVCPLSLR